MDKPRAEEVLTSFESGKSWVAGSMLGPIKTEVVILRALRVLVEVEKVDVRGMLNVLRDEGWHNRSILVRFLGTLASLASTDKGKEE